MVMVRFASNKIARALTLSVSCNFCMACFLVTKLAASPVSYFFFLLATMAAVGVAAVRSQGRGRVRNAVRRARSRASPACVKCLLFIFFHALFSVATRTNGTKQLIFGEIILRMRKVY